MCSAWFTMPVRIEPVSTSIRPTMSGSSSRMKSVMPVEHLAVAAQVARARQRQVEGRPGAGGVADVVDEKSQYRALAMATVRAQARILSMRCASGRGWRRRGASFAGAACARLARASALRDFRMSQANPLRSSSPTCGRTPTTTCACSNISRARAISSIATTARRTSRRCGDKEALKEDLRQQIAPVEAVIALSSLYDDEPGPGDVPAALCAGEQQAGRAAEAVRRRRPVPKVLAEHADEIVDWDERALVDAVRKHARHEDTTRWDTIEFKLD